MTIALDIDHLAWLKAFLLRARRWKSSDLDEALAQALSFRTSAALKALLKRPAVVEADLDLATFASRLDDPDAGQALAHGLCALGMATGETFPAFDPALHATWRLNETARRLVWREPGLAPVIMRSPPVVDTATALAGFCRTFPTETVTGLRDTELWNVVEAAYEELPVTKARDPNPKSLLRRLGLSGLAGEQAVGRFVAAVEASREPILGMDALAIGPWLAMASRGIPAHASDDLEGRILAIARLRLPPVARELVLRAYGGPGDAPGPTGAYRAADHDTRFFGKMRSLEHLERMVGTKASGLRVVMGIGAPRLDMTIAGRHVTIPGSACDAFLADAIMSGTYDLAIHASGNALGPEWRSARQEGFLVEGSRPGLPRIAGRARVTFDPSPYAEAGVVGRTMTVSMPAETTTIAAFLDDLGIGASSRLRTDTERGLLERQVEWAESTTAIAVVMVMVARLSGKFEDFPKSIAFKPFDDQPSFFSIENENGLWRLVSTEVGVEFINENGRTIRDFALSNVRKAIGAPDVSSVDRALRELLVWERDPFPELEAAARTIPLASVRGLLAGGSEALQALGIAHVPRDGKTVDVELARRLVDLAATLGVDVEGQFEGQAVVPDGSDEYLSDEISPLSGAIFRRDLGFVRACIEAGAIVSRPDRFWDPLRIAVTDAGMVSILLEAGADASALLDEDLTYLHELAFKIANSRNGYMDISSATSAARLLLAAGADPTVSAELPQNGYTFPIERGTPLEALRSFIDDDGDERRRRLGQDYSGRLAEAIRVARDVVAILEEAGIPAGTGPR